MDNHKMIITSRRFSLFLGLLLCAFGVAWGQTDFLEVSATADSLLCHGDDNGELYWEITDGISPYTYEWRRLGTSFVFASGSQTIDGLAGPVGGNLEANTYELTVTDAAGNLARDTIEIGEPAALLVIDIEVSNSRCADTCEGWINMTVGGGTGALLTTWSDGFEGSSNRADLCADEYVFFLTDERGCRQKGLIEISAPPAIETDFELTMPSCAGAANGSVVLTASGGTGELAYNWSTGATISALTDAGAGAYQVTVTDAENCISVTSTELPEGPPLQANVQVNYGCGDGRLIVSSSPINGTAPYSYQWSTGSLEPILAQMNSGAYSVSLEDANGCLDTQDFTLNYVEPLQTQEQIRDVSCPGAADGEIEVEISGGVPPYELRWEQGTTGLQRINLAGGSYAYNVNASGCGFARTVTVYEPQPLEVELVFDPQSDDLLTALAFPSGGTFPYQYQWSTGSSGRAASNLVPDQTYFLTITDANACTLEWEVRPSLTDVNFLEAASINVYPNPSTGEFWIDYPSSIAVQYLVYDVHGRLIIEGSMNNSESLQIDLSREPAGGYILLLRTDKGMLRRLITRS